MKVKININTRRVSGEDANVTPDSEEDEEDSESTGDGGDDDYDGVGVRRLPRRTTRPNTRKELPYSPRKSRARRVLTIVESDTENSEYRAGSPAPARRSTRAKRATEIHVIDSDDDDYLDDDDYNAPTKLKVRTKNRNTHIKSAPPMYGHFRDITTLDEDPFSDDEDNEALRRHRAICEKCHLGPADKLLAAFKKKSKSKGKKRKRSTEEFEESDDEDKYINMGGWVQWWVTLLSLRVRQLNACLFLVLNALLALIGNVLPLLSEMKFYAPSGRRTKKIGKSPKVLEILSWQHPRSVPSSVLSKQQNSSAVSVQSHNLCANY